MAAKVRIVEEERTERPRPLTADESVEIKRSNENLRRWLERMIHG